MMETFVLSTQALQYIAGRAHVISDAYEKLKASISISAAGANYSHIPHEERQPWIGVPELVRASISKILDQDVESVA